ncbi:MAG: polysaccharide pyruvyl transferase family protein [Clostridium sp.]|nr:polysaccharide pyruvyl transferase family protein [Clostridium sp.]
MLRSKLRKVKKSLIRKISYLKSGIYYNEFKKYENKKKIFHLSTPKHGNMGDQAIVYATNKYLKDNFPDYEIVEVYREDIYKYAKAIKKVIGKDDFIVLIGGGNMGNLWIDEERDRRFIIKTFPNQKIISMPQTISFTNDSDGENEFLKTKKVYNAHKNLVVIGREKKSYEIMKESFTNNKVILNPDMVLYLNDMFKPEFNNRKGIMTCIRSDKESILGDKKNELIKKLQEKYENVFVYDTVIKRKVPRENREKELTDMFNKFRGARIVITDRLHGMVFSAITKTPCIVTKSLDHKVTGTYEWIKNLNYVKLVDDLTFENINPLIDELLSLTKLSEIDLNEKYFSKLKDKIM